MNYVPRYPRSELREDEQRVYDNIMSRADQSYRAYQYRTVDQYIEEARDFVRVCVLSRKAKRCSHCGQVLSGEQKRW
jgi:hypothetical protein